ncbi:MAG: hypothetical protein ACFBSF_10955 [Leptolyngbyaceae cyanobacterium]
MKEVNHRHLPLVGDLRGQSVGSLKRRQGLDQAYRQILLTRNKSDPVYRDTLLDIIQLYIDEVTHIHTGDLEDLNLLGKLYGLISEAQKLEKIQTFTSYNNAISVAQQAIIEEAPKIQQQLVDITAEKYTNSQLQSVINRLLQHASQIPPIRSTQIYEDLFNQVLRLQIATICQFPADSQEATLVCQRREQFNKLYRLVSKSNKLIGRQEWRSLSWYEESILEIWQDCYLSLEQYEPSIDQLHQTFLNICQQSSDALNLQLFTPLEKNVSSSGWIWRDQAIQNWGGILCQITYQPNQSLEQVCHWVNELDETQRTQKSRQRILIWLSAITWKSDEFQPRLKQFTTWLGDRLWAKLQRDKYRFVTHTQQEVSFSTQGNSENTPQNPLLSFEYKPGRRESRERWDRVLSWAEADPDKVLSQVCFRKRPDVTAQVLIIRRLQSPPVEWQDIAKEFNLTPYKKMIPRLSEFFKRKCYPLIQQYGKEIGIS